MTDKNYLIILIFTFMFSFFERVEAKYQKLFFDLKIKNISGQELNLKQFKGKKDIQKN